MINHMISTSFNTVYTLSTNSIASYNQYKCIAASMLIHALNLIYRMLVFPIVKILQSEVKDDSPRRCENIYIRKNYGVRILL